MSKKVKMIGGVIFALLLIFTVSSCVVDPGTGGGGGGGSGGGTYGVYVGYMGYYSSYPYTLSDGYITADYTYSYNSTFTSNGTYYVWTQSQIQNQLISWGATSSQAATYTGYLLSSSYNFVAYRSGSIVYFIYYNY